MGKLTDLLQLAQERGRELGLPYAGALTPQEAYQVWQLAPGARLVDVRTHAEWDWVGRIPGANRDRVDELPRQPTQQPFPAQLKQQVDREALVMFICRSGIRSHQAAALASQAAQRECYNVLEGFEGDKSTPTASAARSAAGATPACRGATELPAARQAWLS
jgi:rhodanese-related sulfurtransferase